MGVKVTPASGGNPVIVPDAKDVDKRIKALEPYDLIIRNQTEFSDFVLKTFAGSNTNIHSVLLLGFSDTSDSLTYDLTMRLKLPTYIKVFHGLGRPFIYSNFAASSASANLIEGHSDCEIRGIDLSTPRQMYNSGLTQGIVNFGRVSDCTVYINPGTNGKFGFYNCSNLTNCKGVSWSGGDQESVYLFAGCNNLVGCSVESTGEHSKQLFGFYNSYNLTSCSVTIENANTGRDMYIGFYMCRGLANCLSSVEAYATNSASAAFNTCTQLTNCFAKVGKQVTAHFRSCSFASSCGSFSQLTGTYLYTTGSAVWESCTDCDDITCKGYLS